MMALKKKKKPVAFIDKNSVSEYLTQCSRLVQIVPALLHE